MEPKECNEWERDGMEPTEYSRENRYARNYLKGAEMGDNANDIEKDTAHYKVPEGVFLEGLSEGHGPSEIEIQDGYEDEGKQVSIRGVFGHSLIPKTNSTAEISRG